MQTLLASLHQIDRDTNTVIQQQVNSSDAEKFVNNLVVEIALNKNKRAFSFRSHGSEVSSSLLEIYRKKDEADIKELFASLSDLIAKRILYSEKKSVERYPNMRKPKKGSLIITLNTDEDGINSIIIAKIETEEFLSDINLVLTTGLPSEKPALKTATICFTEEDNLEVSTDLVITDSGKTISKYWSEDFLEASELTSDEQNTKAAFTAIERVITLNLKKDAASDYTELRNNLVGYFKTQTSFNFEDMVTQVFGEYSMENDKITTDALKQKVFSLTDKKKFDTHFNLVPGEIRARFKSTYKVTDEIELRTIGHVEGLRHIIRANTNANGERILEIKVTDDKVYESFLFTDE